MKFIEVPRYIATEVRTMAKAKLCHLKRDIGNGRASHAARAASLHAAASGHIDTATLKSDLTLYKRANRAKHEHASNLAVRSGRAPWADAEDPDIFPPLPSILEPVNAPVLSKNICHLLDPSVVASRLDSLELALSDLSDSLPGLRCELATVAGELAVASAKAITSGFEDAVVNPMAHSFLMLTESTAAANDRAFDAIGEVTKSVYDISKQAQSFQQLTESTVTANDRAFDAIKEVTESVHDISKQFSSHDDILSSLQGRVQDLEALLPQLASESQQAPQRILSTGIVLDMLPLPVRLTGLSRASLNGSIGNAVCFLEDKGRCQVVMRDSGESLLIKPSNMVQYVPDYDVDICSNCSEPFNMFSFPICGCDPSTLTAYNSFTLAPYDSFTNNPDLNTHFDF